MTSNYSFMELIPFSVLTICKEQERAILIFNH